MATRRPWLDLLFVLAVVLAISWLHGGRTEPLSVAGFQLKQPDLSDWFEVPQPAELVRPRGTASVVASHTAARADTRVLAGSALPAGAPLQADTGGTPVSHRVLMLGDSMIEPLQQRAAAYFRDAGHKFISVIWYGSRTLDWGKGSRLAQTLQTYAPSYVVVVLGSNELMARDVAERAAHVHHMLQTFGELPVIWIGPPSWREDHGFNAMLATELGDHFFRSETLSFERKSDRIHPTDASGAYWMDRPYETRAACSEECRSAPRAGACVASAGSLSQRTQAPPRRSEVLPDAEARPFRL